MGEQARIRAGVTQQERMGLVPTLTAYLGLCGSGKSYLAGQTTGAVVIDESFFDKVPDLLTALRSGKDCVITEIAFCQKPMREQLVNLMNKEVPGSYIVSRPTE